MKAYTSTAPLYVAPRIRAKPAPATRLCSSLKWSLVARHLNLKISLRSLGSCHMTTIISSARCLFPNDLCHLFTLPQDHTRTRTQVRIKYEEGTSLSIIVTQSSLSARGDSYGDYPGSRSPRFFVRFTLLKSCAATVCDFDKRSCGG